VSVISMLSDPNDESPANIDAAVRPCPPSFPPSLPPSLLPSRPCMANDIKSDREPTFPSSLLPSLPLSLPCRFSLETTEQGSKNVCAPSSASRRRSYREGGRKGGREGRQGAGFVLRFQGGGEGGRGGGQCGDGSIVLVTQKCHGHCEGGRELQ